MICARNTPCEGTWIYDFPIVALDTSFYIFGGSPSATIGTVIASFDTISKQWERLGELKQARWAHGVIVHQGEFIVVGGGGEKWTERCTLNDNSIQCNIVNPELENYLDYPHMISVPANFCPK